ncbi:hypothetical protein T10_3923 [Trichinella papuae]|uniref:Uncharacterized protein n=1 Tax=Trichinella papuae TaxID=268474 RepID=A0A0V1MUT9_9BILA|nr:hypothetical protein T10_3923 [Trichinella papuae]
MNGYQCVGNFQCSWKIDRNCSCRIGQVKLVVQRRMTYPGDGSRPSINLFNVTMDTCRILGNFVIVDGLINNDVDAYGFTRPTRMDAYFRCSIRKSQVTNSAPSNYQIMEKRDDHRICARCEAEVFSAERRKKNEDEERGKFAK